MYGVTRVLSEPLGDPFGVPRVWSSAVCAPEEVRPPARLGRGRHFAASLSPIIFAAFLPLRGRPVVGSPDRASAEPEEHGRNSCCGEEQTFQKLSDAHFVTLGARHSSPQSPFRPWPAASSGGGREIFSHGTNGNNAMASWKPLRDSSAVHEENSSRRPNCVFCAGIAIRSQSDARK